MVDIANTVAGGLLGVVLATWNRMISFVVMLVCFCAKVRINNAETYQSLTPNPIDYYR